VIPPPHTTSRLDGTNKRRRVQAGLQRIQIWRWTWRARPAHGPRMGDAGKSVSAFDGVRAAVSAFRGKQNPRRDAGLAARRLEGRRNAVVSGVRNFEFSR